MIRPSDLATTRTIVIAGLLRFFGLKPVGIPETATSGRHADVLTLGRTITPVLRFSIYQCIASNGTTIRATR